ncbi:MAG: hypothetical protein WC454_04670 [Phycisphaerae bacterium]
MRRSCTILIVTAVITCLVSRLYGETVFFLVAETYPHYNDSYVLPLSEPNDIAHARALIEFGPDIGRAIVVAAVSCSPDCINRDYLAPNKPAWSWHVESFEGFADYTIEILDGNPGALEADCEDFLNNSGGYIGFWHYTVVDELNIDPNYWNCDLDDDNDVDFSDYSLWSARWTNDDCTSANSWCDGSDLNKNGHVDYADLKLFADAWLSPHFPPEIWFDCWTNCPYQCYGDAGCSTSGPPGYYRVDGSDLLILVNSLGSYYPSEEYNPCADFDRDLDVDEDDSDILLLNYWKKDSDFTVICQTCW